MIFPSSHKLGNEGEFPPKHPALYTHEYVHKPNPNPAKRLLSLDFPGWVHSSFSFLCTGCPFARKLPLPGRAM